ncbi:MAG: ABC transporter substrate-binding protein [Ottowia sp.]|uniref:ABC transporter substrate-binding protein n=1 Tax=Ottowia sp. TaxID=1898956 RepID=UPI0039E722B8
MAAALGADYLQASEVVVGQVAPLSGMEASQGRAYSTGMQLIFDSVNKAGGVNGHSFKLVRRDDGGRPADTVSATKQIVAEHKPLILAGYFGGRNVSELVGSGILERERIALIGYRIAEIRPETPWLYNVRASLSDEVNKIAEHLATIGVTRLGLFYEEGPSAHALIAAADEAAKRARVAVVSRASYPAGTASVATSIGVFLKSAPQAIILVSSGAAAAVFIEQYRGAGGAAQLFAHSGADVEQLAKRLAEEQMQGVAIAQVTPSPYKVSSPLTKEFTDLVAKSNSLEVPVSYAMIEGYITAKVIVEAVRRQGPRPSREAMPISIESVNNLNLAGYALNFRPGQRTGSKFVELSIVTSAGKIRQ